MKALRFFSVVFIILIGSIFTYILYVQAFKYGLHDSNIVTITGIGLIIVVLGLFITILQTNWYLLKKELKQAEADSLKMEHDKRIENLKLQSEENQERRAFEARIQPPQFAEIMKASKLLTKSTKENIDQSKEFIETETFDESIFDKAINELNKETQNHMQ